MSPQWHSKGGGSSARQVRKPIRKVATEGGGGSSSNIWDPNYDPGAALSTMTAGPIASNNVNGSGWLAQNSDATSTIVYSTTTFPHMECTVNPPSSDNTNYARIRIPTNTTLGISPAGIIRMKYTFFLPSDFWTKNNSYMRFCGWDNFGNDISQEYRPGVYVYGPSAGGDTRKLMLMSAHEGNEEYRIWQSAQNACPTILPANATHVIEYAMKLASTAVGWAWIKVNGTVLYNSYDLNPGGVRTQPNTITTAEKPLTRAYCGIDGAANQVGPMTVWPRECKIWGTAT